MSSTDPTDPRRLFDLAAHRNRDNRPLAMIEPPRRDGTFSLNEIVVEARLGGLLRHYFWQEAV